MAKKFCHVTKLSQSCDLPAVHVFLVGQVALVVPCLPKVNVISERIYKDVSTLGTNFKICCYTCLQVHYIYIYILVGVVAATVNAVSLQQKSVS